MDWGTWNCGRRRNRSCGWKAGLRRQPTSASGARRPCRTGPGRSRAPVGKDRHFLISTRSQNRTDPFSFVGDMADSGRTIPDVAERFSHILGNPPRITFTENDPDRSRREGEGAKVGVSDRRGRGGHPNFSGRLCHHLDFQIWLTPVRKSMVRMSHSSTRFGFRSPETSRSLYQCETPTQHCRPGIPCKMALVS